MRLFYVTPQLIITMKKLIPYLAFDGNCEEVLNFYAACLGGEVTSMMRFSDAPNETPPGSENKVMHAEFHADGITFMASDTMPHFEHVVGSNITLSIDLATEDEQTAIFDKLADGGNVQMPLDNTFWGSRFGMLTDKYGINWMLSVEKKQ